MLSGLKELIHQNAMMCLWGTVLLDAVCKGLSRRRMLISGCVAGASSTRCTARVGVCMHLPPSHLYWCTRP